MAEGLSDDPFAVLGRHPAPAGGPAGAIIRTLQLHASAVDLVAGDRVIPMERRHPNGLFAAFVPWEGPLEALGYHLRVHEDGAVRDVVDPYQFGPILTDFDLHLFAEGTALPRVGAAGSRERTVGTVSGAHFAVWAPNAQRVSLIGDFNRWDGRAHVMRRLVPSGVWEIFVPGLHDGTRYKFEVRTRDGHLLEKADPYARTLRDAAADGVGGVHRRHLRLGRRRVDAHPRGARASGTSGRCRSTRSTSARGAGVRASRSTACRIASWRPRSCPTPATWATRTSSSCR